MKKTGGVGERRMGAERLRRREGSALNSNSIFNLFPQEVASLFVFYAILSLLTSKYLTNLLNN